MFQIWIETDKPVGPARLGREAVPEGIARGRFQLLASGDAEDGALTINADARVLGATVKAGEVVAIDAEPDRHLYLVPAAGSGSMGSRPARATVSRSPARTG